MFPYAEIREQNKHTSESQFTLDDGHLYKKQKRTQTRTKKGIRKERKAKEEEEETQGQPQRVRYSG